VKEVTRNDLNKLFPLFASVFKVFFSHYYFDPSKTVRAPKPSKHALTGYLASLNTNAGGVGKKSREGDWLTPMGFLTDHQKASFVAGWGGHGGKDKAICIWSLEIIQLLQSEGHRVYIGTCGENMTVAGLGKHWKKLKPGMRAWVGDALLEFTEPASPCKKQISHFKNGNYFRITHKDPTICRWYCEVVQPGYVRKNSTVILTKSKVLDDKIKNQYGGFPEEVIVYILDFLKGEVLPLQSDLIYTRNAKSRTNGEPRMLQSLQKIEKHEQRWEKEQWEKQSYIHGLTSAVSGVASSTASYFSSMAWNSGTRDTKATRLWFLGFSALIIIALIAKSLNS